MKRRKDRTADFDWLHIPAACPDLEVKRTAESRQALLTKPPSALGRLEEISVRLCALQRTERPGIERIRITVFAGDHGVAREGVSAFPQSVTAEMIRNFAMGGAAINVAARAIDAGLEIVNLGTVQETADLNGVINVALGPGTANFTRGPAMSEHQLARSLSVGRHAAERARLARADLFIGGEMGIGNTTASTALACALLGERPDRIAGPGTGLDRAGLAHKIDVIERALNVHRDQIESPLEAVRRLGGFEIAALTGAYLACAHMGLPVLVDGFICSVAALAATRLCPNSDAWFLFAHRSAEPGHRIVLESLGARPLLSLGMHLGEGSGAALAVPLLRTACALHNEMATFDEARVSSAKTT